MTGLGREAFWDPWKTPVTEWNLAELRRLVHELQHLIDADHGPDVRSPGAPSSEALN
jgi:hypothetical protein